MAKTDFHMHSLYSDDGDYTPEALVDMAHAAGLAAISLCDHNTAHGVARAMACGKELGVRVIPGIELDCLFDGVVFHTLGYGIDPADARLARIGEDILAQERRAAKERIRLVNELGIPLAEEEALAKSGNGVVTGELIAEIVLGKPDAGENPLLAPYLAGGPRSSNPYVNFYWDYCSQGKPAYVPIHFISLQEAIAVIHGSGGVAVLAHPGQNLKERAEMLAPVLDAGLDGIECYSSYHTPRECLYYQEAALARGLLVTGGSDFHGKTKPSIAMGRFGLGEDGLALLARLEEAIAARRGARQNVSL